MEIVAPPEQFAVHTEGGTPVIGVPGMVGEEALVEEEISDEALGHGVAEVEGMGGKDRMEQVTGPQTLALMLRTPRMNSGCFEMRQMQSKAISMP